uniref:KH domain-containing protein n=1 Tax=Strongyloides papillosus TaxID=174720 RepID=A0A0N5B9Q7_STREA
MNTITENVINDSASNNNKLGGPTEPDQSSSDGIILSTMDDSKIAPTIDTHNNNNTSSIPSVTSSTGISNNNHTITHQSIQQNYTVEYLAELVKDRKQLLAFPGIFIHIERLLDEEINRVRFALFQFEFTKEQLILPSPIGEVITVTEKVFVPVKAYPEYNFVGRILGPRGMTAKQLEQETGCKIMVRGKGSMRDKKKEDMNRGKPNWEHLSEDLHVLIQCEDTKNRCDVKIQRAIEEVRKLLVPAPEGEDELKKKQLMELAIINGTYRTGSNGLPVNPLTNQPLATGALTNTGSKSLAGSSVLASTLGSIVPQIRSPSLVGTPIVLQQNATPQHRSTPNSAAAAAIAAQAQIQAAQQAAAINLINQNNSVNGSGGVLGGGQLLAAAGQQVSAEYQQLLLNQLGYDALNGAAVANAAAIHHQQQQQYAAMLMAQSGQGLLGEYQQYDLTGALLPSSQRRSNTLNNIPSTTTTAVGSTPSSSVRAETHPYYHPSHHHHHGTGTAGKQT